MVKSFKKKIRIENQTKKSSPSKKKRASRKGFIQQVLEKEVIRSLPESSLEGLEVLTKVELELFQRYYIKEYLTDDLDIYSTTLTKEYSATYVLTLPLIGIAYFTSSFLINRFFMEWTNYNILISCVVAAISGVIPFLANILSNRNRVSRVLNENSKDTQKENSFIANNILKKLHYKDAIREDDNL